MLVSLYHNKGTLVEQGRQNFFTSQCIAGAGHQIRGRAGATLALQSLGAWRAPSVQLGAGWSQVSKTWPWSYSCLRLLKQNQYQFSFLLGMICFTFMPSFWREINACKLLAPVPVVKVSAPGVRLWPCTNLSDIQHNWKERSQHLQSEESDTHSGVGGGEHARKHTQLGLIAVKKASHPQAVDAHFLPSHRPLCLP